MAKKSGSVVNLTLLAAINSGAVTRVSQSDGLPLVNNNPPLIEVNTTDVVDGLAAVRITDAGKAQLGGNTKAAVAASDTPIYAIINGFVPPVKVRKAGGRGGAGAPTIYPWATMEVGASFFVGVSAKPDPVKSLTSAVSSANMKYSEEVGEEKPHTRTKRGPGNKAVLGPDGKPERETVMRKDRQAVKKFELAAVTKGTTYGDFTAIEDGVMVWRSL